MTEGTTTQPRFPDAAVIEQWKGRTLDTVDIMGLIPHRPPFLLLDRVIELEPAQRAVGLKAVTINEWFFAGHYPGHPIMPGVLIVEAMSQLGAIVVMTGMAPSNDKPYFIGIEKARFRRPVRPGDTLRLEATLISARVRFGRIMSEIALKAFVDTQLVSEAKCSYALVATDD